MKYTEIRNKQPEMTDCFFAFSNDQLAAGLKKYNLKIQDIVSGGMGLYGTRNGIKKFRSFYGDQAKEIGEKCDPQQVYDYEFDNHECDYTCDDTEAIKITVAYFGEERAKKVKRRNGRAYVRIDDIIGD